MLCAVNVEITPETTGGNDSDEENSRVGSSSSGTSREPMSVSNLNVITRQSGDTTGTFYNKSRHSINLANLFVER